VLDVVSGHLKLDIEVKRAAAAEAVLAEVAHYPDLDWLISSFYWDSLRYVRERQPDAELWVLWPSATPEAIDVAVEVGATILNLEYSTVTRATVEAVEARGVKVGVWTVNDVAEAERLRDIGVAAICTDDPAALKDVYGS
jgi:glycerophosphoryl diester phosphodiesterase